MSDFLAERRTTSVASVSQLRGDDIVVFHATVWSGARQSALEQLGDMVESVDCVPRT